MAWKYHQNPVYRLLCIQAYRSCLRDRGPLPLQYYQEIVYRIFLLLPDHIAAKAHLQLHAFFHRPHLSPLRIKLLFTGIHLDHRHHPLDHRRNIFPLSHLLFHPAQAHRAFSITLFHSIKSWFAPHAILPRKCLPQIRAKHFALQGPCPQI